MTEMEKGNFQLRLVVGLIDIFITDFFHSRFIVNKLIEKHIRVNSIFYRFTPSLTRARGIFPLPPPAHHICGIVSHSIILSAGTQSILLAIVEKVEMKFNLIMQNSINFHEGSENFENFKIAQIFHFTQQTC
jgi:hypothetical protein